MTSLIHGIGSEYAELLEAAGGMQPELARRNPVNLAKTWPKSMRRRVTRCPSETEVAKWIEQAKTLPRAPNTKTV